MGEVWRARDTKLDRDVAIKALPDEFAADPERLSRFEREARLLASLNHPGIAAIYGLEEQGDLRYLVLELVEGETLAERLERGAIPVEESLELALQVTDALDAAHESGVIHRDIKPANIKVTPAGRVKVLDFGLAKQQVGTGEDAPTMAGSASPTEPGRIIGTMAYMSPEQAEGRPLDSRSDIFSFGVVLYEMLCGRRPFAGATPVSTLAAILRDAPASPHDVHSGIPDSLGRVVLKALEKDPDSRFASARVFNQALAACRKASPAWLRRGPLVASLAVAVIAVAGVLGGLAVRDASNVARAEDAIPQIDRLLTEARPWAALQLYREAEPYIPGSRELHLFDDALRTGYPMRIETDPPGATIYLTDYADPDDDWQQLGTSPVDVDSVPNRGYYRIRAVLDGYAPTEWSPVGRQVSMTLQREDAAPERMVWVPGVDENTPAIPGSILPQNYTLQDFWLAEYEVTNREYQEFVDAGGYQAREYWREDFQRDGVTVTWADAMDTFVDATGSSGPATWEFGAYPEGEADFPVSGISWYEAMAFAEFMGMRLPTIQHWYRAAGATGFFGGITQSSNLGGSGPQEVGAGGISAYGARDMAGNVKEWVATPDRSGLRYILGASWQEASYAWVQPDARQPISREADFGFRLARYPESAEAVVPVALSSGTAEEVPSIDDATFEIYRAQLSYDRIRMDVRREQRESASPFVRQERLWLRLPGRDEERIMAHLFLPVDQEPPFQVVTLFGSGGVLQAPSIEELDDPFRFLVRLGRAVVVPVFDGTLERGPFQTQGPNEMRDHVRAWVEDLGRAIDFLETHPEEFDTTRIGHLGQSFGAMMSPTLLVAEPRIRAAVFLSGGLQPPVQSPVEVHPSIYAPHVSIPVLMLNGRDDYIYPYETSQLVLFNLLGTPDDDKRLRRFDGGHINLLSNMDLVRETVSWLDEQLGPVGTAR